MSLRGLSAIVFLVPVLGLTAPAKTTSVEQAAVQTRKDIADATAQRNALRETHQRARSALSAEVRALQDQVRTMRERWQAVQRADIAMDAERARMRERADALDREYRHAQNMLLEFRRAQESRLHPADLQRYRTALEAIDARLADDDESGATMETLAPLLDLAHSQIRSSIGAQPFPGRAIDSAGRAHEGLFLVLGPMALFASDAATGYAVLDAGGTEPIIHPGMRAGDQRALAAALRGETQLIPLDASGGSAIRIERARASWTEHVRSGGIIMIPLVALGLVCVVLALHKLHALRRMDIEAEESVTHILEALSKKDTATAHAIAGSLVSPWKEVLEDAIHHAQAEEAYLEEVLQDQILSQAPRVEQYLGALAVSAAAAPLLGLLGTVTGMINTFRLITIFGTGDARTLSGGISEALVTTQFGLLIAIPALLAHAWLSRRAKRIIAGLEQAAVRFVREIPAAREKAESS